MTKTFFRIRKKIRNEIFKLSGFLFGAEICQRSKFAKTIIKFYHNLIEKIDPLRLKQSKFEKENPSLPRFVPNSIPYIESLLNPDFVGFEWGSGRSTIWFSQRTKYITSVEYNKDWYDKVSGIITDKKMNNKIKYNFTPITKIHSYTKKDIYIYPYLSFINHIPDNSLNYVVVDGMFRLECIQAALPKIVPGGILIFDNSDLPEYNIVHDTFKKLDSKTFTNGIWETSIFIGKSTNGFYKRFLKIIF